MSKLKMILDNLDQETTALMQSEAQILQRAHLKDLIKRVSQAHGGDDPDFLSLYIDNVITGWDSRLNQAIACFESVLNNYSLK